MAILIYVGQPVLVESVKHKKKVYGTGVVVGKEIVKNSILYDILGYDGSVYKSIEDHQVFAIRDTSEKIPILYGPYCTFALRCHKINLKSEVEKIKPWLSALYADISAGKLLVEGYNTESNKEFVETTETETKESVEVVK